MKSYLRFLGRNKLYTAIMAVGLSVSLAFVIIMSCFVWQNTRVNRMYPDQDRMYAIGRKGSLHSNDLMAGVMMDAIPEIVSATTVVNSGTESFSTIDGVAVKTRSMMGIEKNFFEFFPTRFIYGDESVMNDVDNVIVTKSLANAHGGKDVIGKRLNLGGFLDLTVAAVIEDFDDTMFADEQIVVNLGHSKFAHRREGKLWTAGNGILSVIKVNEKTDENELLKKIDEVYGKDISEMARRDSYLSLTRLDKIYTSENNSGYDGLKKGNARLLTAFSIIVMFLLISAIFNYINLSTALSGKRSKEFASRMILGEDKTKVFRRSIYESIGFMTICMCFALLIAYASLPVINRMVNSPIPIVMRFSHEYIYMYLLILGVIALICGIIPALITLNFKPIEVIKGHFRHESKKTFSKIFIIIQNVIAIVIIAVALTMESQIKHMMDMPLNANTDSLFICTTSNNEFEKTLQELPYVETFGRAYGRPGESYGSYGFPLNNDFEKQVRLGIFECDATAFNLFGFKIVRNYGLPSNEGVWLMESAVRKLEIDPDNPVFPEQNSWVIGDAKIAGIIEDVPCNLALSLDDEMVGMVTVSPQYDNNSHFVAKLSDPSPDNIRELHALCTKEIVEIYGPEIAQLSGYCPDMNAMIYDDMRKQITMVELFMVIAILLSALGQVAMSTYYATEREKEIGIRKVFGGTVRSESIRNIFEYMIYCIIACVIAVPVSVVAAGRYLETFVYKMPQKPWIYVLAAVSAFAISLASVLWQTLKAARTNPAEALKKE